MTKTMSAAKACKSPALANCAFFKSNFRYVGRGCHCDSTATMLKHFMEHSSVSTSKDDTPSINEHKIKVDLKTQVHLYTHRRLTVGLAERQSLT